MTTLDEKPLPMRSRYWASQKQEAAAEFSLSAFAQKASFVGVAHFVTFCCLRPFVAQSDLV
jgi:hypothetical protein